MHNNVTVVVQNVFKEYGLDGHAVYQFKITATVIGYSGITPTVPSGWTAITPAYATSPVVYEAYADTIIGVATLISDLGVTP